MHILKSQKGMSFAAVLGIAMFVVASVTTVFVVVLKQSRLVDVTIENTAEYENAVIAVKSTLGIIIREQTLDSGFLSGLSGFMGVDILDLGNGVFSVSGTVDSDQIVTSYILYDDAIESTYETFLQYTGSEPGFSLNPTVRVQYLLGAYITQFVNAEYGMTAPTFTTFASIMTYYEGTVRTANGYVNMAPNTLQNMVNPTLSVDTYVTGTVTLAKNKDLTIHGNVYINGNLTLGTSGDITIDDGAVLIVDGILTIKNNARITGGTLIVNGSLTINSSNNGTTEYIRSTLYVRDNFTSDRHVVFGDDVSGPTFLFCGIDCNLDSNNQNTATGIVYIVANRYYGNNAGVVLTGGVYTVTATRQVSAAGIAPNSGLIAGSDLFLMGVADSLGVSTGGIPGFRFTFPVIE
ncbi:MAG TPA: hypothetical protein PLZ76_00840 [Bacillota bacterium]|nr:hypothetical protein [Bacillota bacterium]